MPRYKTLLLGSAAILALYLAVTAGPAVAQAVQATLVRLTDEPGRNPYESTVIFHANVDGTVRNPCGPHFCGVVFARVPAGKRLVLQNVTGLIRVSSRIHFLTLGSDGNGEPHRSLIPVRDDQYFNDVFQFNQLISGYIEPGQAPLLSIDGIDVFRAAGQGSQVKVTGYLADISE